MRRQMFFDKLADRHAVRRSDPLGATLGRTVMGQRRHELSDEEWALLEPLLPGVKTPGRYYKDHRRILNGMLFRISTGIPWRDLPDRYGPWQTVYSRHRRWSRSGLWGRVLAALQRDSNASGQIEWSIWSGHGSDMGAHEAAAAGGKKSARTRSPGSRAVAQPREIGHKTASGR